MPATDGATPKLNEALAAFQAKVPKVGKRATANMGTYTSDYAPLEDLTAAAMPQLGEHGLALTDFPTINAEGNFVLAYTLLHASGEERSGEYPLPDKGTPQQLGSAITYARRYILCAVTGVAPGGEDDDGAAAQHQEVRMDRPRTRPQPPAHANGADMWDEVRHEERRGSALPADLAAIQRAYTRLGFDTRTDREEVQAISGQLVGRGLNGPVKGQSHKNLTFHEAKQLRAELEGFGEPPEGRAALVERITGSRAAAEAMAAQDAAEGSQEAGP